MGRRRTSLREDFPGECLGEPQFRGFACSSCSAATRAEPWLHDAWRSEPNPEGRSAQTLPTSPCCRCWVPLFSLGRCWRQEAFTTVRSGRFPVRYLMPDYFAPFPVDFYSCCARGELLEHSSLATAVSTRYYGPFASNCTAHSWCLRCWRCFAVLTLALARLCGCRCGFLRQLLSLAFPDRPHACRTAISHTATPFRCSRLDWTDPWRLPVLRCGGRRLALVADARCCAANRILHTPSEPDYYSRPSSQAR